MTSTAIPSSRAVTSSPVVVALDYDNRDKALAFVDRIDPRDCRLKVGKEMFTLLGPQFVRDLHQRGFEVFLDLKFHDIPNTTARAVAAAAELGVWMVNVHASGGARMMTAAREALLPFGKDAPLLIAVTVLTSMESSDLQDLGITLSPADYAAKLAALTQRCGLDGVVCSAQEAVRFKHELGQAFKLVTPGIRPQGSDAGDQRRIMTPEQAQEAGVDYMVIGRPVTQSADPAATLRAINDSLRKVTPGGKVVYGGGGIMPDLFVPVDTTDVTRYFLEVSGRNILFRYTLEYADRHRDALNAVKTIPELQALLDADKELMNDFIRYAARNGVQPDYRDIARSRKLIEAQLRAYIGRNTPLNEAGFYVNIYPIDPVMLRAVEVFKTQNDHD